MVRPFNFEIAMRNKVKFWLRLVAGLELFAAISGIISIYSLLGPWIFPPHMNAVPNENLDFEHPLAPPIMFGWLITVYIVLILINGVAGLRLWRFQFSGIVLSIFAQSLQIPYYATRIFPYRPLGLSFTSANGWNAREGVEPGQEGLNWLPLILIVILIVCERFWQAEDAQIAIEQPDNRQPPIPPVDS